MTDAELAHLKLRFEWAAEQGGVLHVDAKDGLALIAEVERLRAELAAARSAK